MIEPSKLIIGTTYYSLMYYGPHDPNFLIPSITPYVYTGENLRGEKADGDRWWLQDPSTYMLYGILIDYPNEFRSGVRIADEHFLSTLYDLNGLIEQLQELAAEVKESCEMVPGRVYYFISYYDLKLTIPIFDAHIYIGTAEDKDEKDKVITLYLFQEPSTYQLDGGKGDVPEVEDADLSADSESLHRFYDLHRLTTLLSELRDRTAV